MIIYLVMLPNIILNEATVGLKILCMAKVFKGIYNLLTVSFFVWKVAICLTVGVFNYSFNKKNLLNPHLCNFYPDCNS